MAYTPPIKEPVEVPQDGGPPYGPPEPVEIHAGSITTVEIADTAITIEKLDNAIGLTSVYSINPGGASGTLATITVTKGIITGATTNP